MSIDSLRRRKASDAAVTTLDNKADPQKRHRVNHEELRAKGPQDIVKTSTGRNKFTLERQDIIATALLHCNYRKVAASLAGIRELTLQAWLKRGREEAEEGEETEYSIFYDRVIAAEAQAEADILDYVRDAVPEDWKAGMELLRRRHPKRWNRDKLELTGKKGGPVQFKVIYDDKDSD